MKIHIIGHLGMLGREACEILSLNHDVASWYGQGKKEQGR